MNDTVNSMAKFMDEAKEDIRLNFLEIENELLRNSHLIGKWLTYQQNQKSKVLILETEYKRLLAIKKKYLMGKLPDEERDYMGWPLEGTKILKADMDMWLDCDDEIIAKRQKFQAQKQILEFIESTLTQVVDKKWSIKSYIDYKKWIEGN
jgi:hypothetical protein|tara:strand:- start:262 stop:711 length:450 start_codon:yes stop_codon:yes gene_type:complete